MRPHGFFGDPPRADLHRAEGIRDEDEQFDHDHRNECPPRDTFNAIVHPEHDAERQVAGGFGEVNERGDFHATTSKQKRTQYATWQRDELRSEQENQNAIRHHETFGRHLRADPQPQHVSREEAGSDEGRSYQESHDSQCFHEEAVAFQLVAVSL